MNTQPKTKTTILKLHRATPEARKVNVEDGYTSIPNQLLDAILEFDFSNAQRKVVLAVLRKTLSWRKEVDWICNEQLAELANLPDISKASRTKNELLRMNVLVQDGKKIGVNLIISEWKNAVVQNDKIVQNDKQNCTKQQKVLYETTTTKGTIQNINKNTPLPPTGKSAVADDDAVSGLAENSETTTACKKSKLPPVDYAGIAQAYNDAVIESGKPLPKVADPEHLSDKRKRAVHKLAKQFQKRFGQYTPSAFRDYFDDFMRSASSWYFGENNRGWKADFDYLLRETTLDKTIEGGL